MTIYILSFFVIFSPLIFTILLTSGLSRMAKLIWSAALLIVILVVPLLVLDLSGNLTL